MRRSFRSYAAAKTLDMIREGHVDDHPIEGGDVEGTVVSRAFYGHDGTVRIALADGSVVTARVHASRLPAPRSTVSLSVQGPVSVFPNGD